MVGGGYWRRRYGGRQWGQTTYDGSAGRRSNHVCDPGEGGTAVHDQFDVSLEDPELMVEVEMTTALIIAASESDGPLSQEEIDALLGITPDK